MLSQDNDPMASPSEAEPASAVPHIAAPHPDLQNALFCYAAGDDGASAILIRGWPALVAKIEEEVARGDVPWSELLADLDCWSNDGCDVPYSYNESFEDGYMAIYRISEARSAEQLPDPLGCRGCTHPDCGRFDGTQSVECAAIAFNACGRPDQAVGLSTQPQQGDEDHTSREQYKRMFLSACEALGAIGETLGLHPEAASPIELLTATHRWKANQKKRRGQAVTAEGGAAC